MKPHPEADRLTAFVDGELDLASHLAIEAQAADDATLRARLDELRRGRDQLRNGATYHTAPAALRERIARVTSPADRAHDGDAADVRATERATRPRRWSALAALSPWFAWRPLAGSLAFAALIVVAANVVGWRIGATEHLADDVVASHVRATLGQHLVDVASSDHHTVKPWLSARLDYSPPVPELAGTGATFLGGRLDYLEGRPVAALVYRQGQHVVTSFVWPAEEAGDTAPRYVRQRGFETGHWRQSGMHHWVVSDLNPEEFSRVVAAIRGTEPTR